MLQNRFQQPLLGGAKKGLPKLVKLIEDLICEQGLHLKEIRAIGLAVPGPVSIKTGRLLTPPNMPGWADVQIVRDLSEQLLIPVFMDNDANAGALAEWVFGKRENVESLIYLTMSTGMGAGIVWHGQVIQGGSDTAGEVGHCILDPKGPQCLCGQRGCFEAFCGGASVARILREEVNKHRDSLILKAANGKVEHVDMQCLFSAIKQKDPFALAFWQEYIERLSQGIGMIVQFFNPDVLYSWNDCSPSCRSRDALFEKSSSSLCVEGPP